MAAGTAAWSTCAATIAAGTTACSARTAAVAACQPACDETHEARSATGESACAAATGPASDDAQAYTTASAGPCGTTAARNPYRYPSSAPQTGAGQAKYKTCQTIALVQIGVPSVFHRRWGSFFMHENPPNRILVFQAPGKIFSLKSLCTGGVNLKREIAENFFKLWIARGLVCITGGFVWIARWISVGKI